jgi:hypothetical protein
LGGVLGRDGSSFALLHFAQPLLDIVSGGSLEEQRFNNGHGGGVNELHVMRALLAQLPDAAALQIDPENFGSHDCRTLVFEVPQHVVGKDKVARLPQFHCARGLLLKVLRVFDRVVEG